MAFLWEIQKDPGSAVDFSQRIRPPRERACALFGDDIGVFRPDHAEPWERDFRFDRKRHTWLEYLLEALCQSRRFIHHEPDAVSEEFAPVHEVIPIYILKLFHRF